MNLFEIPHFSPEFIQHMMARMDEMIKHAIEQENPQLNKIMSQLSDLAATLQGLTDKLAAIDTAVKALVAAAGNTTLDGPTQAALDALTAEVNTLGTDATPPASTK